MVDQFNYGKSQEPLVYVHSHFQHFKKTIEDNHFKEKAEEAMKNVVIDTKKTLNNKRNTILEVENNFLNEWGKISGKTGRDEFKASYKSAVESNKLFKDYVQLRDEKDFSNAEFKKYVETNMDKVEGMTKKGAKSKYIKDKVAKYKKLFLNIAIFLEATMKYYQSLAQNDDTKTLLKNLQNYKNAAHTIGTVNLQNYGIDEPSETMLQVVETLKKIAMGDAENYKQAGGKAFISKLFKAVNETVLELITIAALSGAIDIVGNADNKNFIEWVGGLGGKGEEGTTDFIFNLGKLKIGFDFKANREVYSKAYTQNFGIINFVAEALITKAAIPGGEEMTNLYAYAMTNMYVMNAIRQLEIEIPKAQEVDQGFLKRDIQISLQRLALVSTTVHFIKTYIEFFNNELRDQIVIVLSERVFFLSEFMDRVAELLENYQGGEMKYDSLGFVNFAKSSKKSLMTNTGLVDQNAIKELNDVKYIRWARLMAANTARDERTSFISKGPTNTNFYPSLFKASNRQMSAIAKKVLGNNFSVNLKFKFDQSINIK